MPHSLLIISGQFYAIMAEVNNYDQDHMIYKVYLALYRKCLLIPDLSSLLKQDLVTQAYNPNILRG